MNLAAAVGRNKTKNEKKMEKRWSDVSGIAPVFFALALNRYRKCFSFYLDTLIKQNWHSY